MSNIIKLKYSEKPEIDTSVLIALYEKAGWTKSDELIKELIQSLDNAVHLMVWATKNAQIPKLKEKELVSEQILAIISIAETLGLVGLVGIALEAMAFWVMPGQYDPKSRDAMIARVERAGYAHIKALDILVDLPVDGPCKDEQER